MKLKRIFHYYWLQSKKYKGLLFSTLFFYGIATVLSNILSPYIFKQVIDVISASVVSPETASKLMNLVLYSSATILVYNMLYRVGEYSIVRFETKSMRDLSMYTFERLTKNSYSFFTNSFAGALVAKAKRFTSTFEGLVENLIFDFFFLVIKLGGILFILFSIIPKLAFFLLGWVLFYIFITCIFVKKKAKFDVALAEADSKVTGSLADVIGNILNLKIFSSTRKEVSTFNDVVSFEYRTRIKNWNFELGQRVFQGFMTTLLQAMTIYLVIKLWLAGEISAGTVVLAQTYIILIFDSLWNISRTLSRFVRYTSNTKEMVDIFDNAPDILDPISPQKLAIDNGHIKFSNISFEYVEDIAVFQDFSLNIMPGEKVGLVGHSGSGKSTITKMILRFADLKQGSITIDGQDIRDITQDDLRSVISYVPQDPILFHRSIAENIGYSKSDATREEIEEAAKKAHAHEFIKDLSNGYDTLVGERGVKLSGGERQRVAIARAMLKDAPILILDEATSSLDSISETYIQQAFDELMKGKTTIVIAHRLSTIQKMDRIVVLDKGRIIEEGTHKELLEKGGTYEKLWNHQTGGFLE